MTIRRIAGWAMLGFWAAGLAVAEPPVVTISEPPVGFPAFGELDFAVEVLEGDVARVRFLVDGELVGEVEEPPYRVRIDTGEENRSRRFEAQAISSTGEIGTSLVVTPAIRVDDEIEAELQQLYVTVTRDGRRVLDLNQKAFRVVDDGYGQNIVTFARGDVRLTATLLIDSSTSMKGRRLRYALRGATAFLEGLKEIDDADMLLFSDHLIQTTPVLNDAAELTAGLAGVQATGGTALNDHLYLALKRLEARQGRRVIVLLSDGIDSHSTLRMADVHWLARRSRALIYWIRIDPGGSDPTQRLSSWKNPETYKEEYRLLTRTVEASGGRIVQLEKLQEAETAFQAILDELREQYVIGYYPSISRNDGRWHEVKVDVAGAGLAVRTQKGYIDY